MYKFLFSRFQYLTFILHGLYGFTNLALAWLASLVPVDLYPHAPRQYK
jgi:hypothetical protein